MRSRRVTQSSSTCGTLWIGQMKVMHFTHRVNSHSNQCSTAGEQKGCGMSFNGAVIVKHELYAAHFHYKLLFPVPSSAPCCIYDQSLMVDPLSYFLFQTVLHDWCNKGCGMCYPVCGMGHIKDSLLLIKKSSPCSGMSGPLPYIWCYITVYKMCHFFTAEERQKETNKQKSRSLLDFLLSFISEMHNLSKAS